MLQYIDYISIFKLIDLKDFSCSSLVGAMMNTHRYITAKLIKINYATECD